MSSTMKLFLLACLVLSTQAQNGGNQGNNGGNAPPGQDNNGDGGPPDAPHNDTDGPLDYSDYDDYFYFYDDAVHIGLFLTISGGEVFISEFYDDYDYDYDMHPHGEEYYGGDGHDGPPKNDDWNGDDQNDWNGNDQNDWNGDDHNDWNGDEQKDW